MSDMQITRKDVLWRAVNIWAPYHVPYNMAGYSNGWRTDCSGYVSMCLNLTSEKPGASTETLVSNGHIHEITRDELRPGDMVGLAGPVPAARTGTSFCSIIGLRRTRGSTGDMNRPDRIRQKGRSTASSPTRTTGIRVISPTGTAESSATARGPRRTETGSGSG